MEVKIFEKCPRSNCGHQQIPAVSVAFSLAIMSVEIGVTMVIGLFIWWSTHCYTVVSTIFLWLRENCIGSVLP